MASTARRLELNATDEALQQATAGAVAVHRARRLSGRIVHDATCSVGTELAALNNSASGLIGSDLDAVRLAMARHNVGDRAQLCRADALHPVTRDTVVVVDPARRSSGRRKFDPRDYSPPLDELLQACTRYLGAAPRDFITFEYCMLDGVNDQPEHARFQKSLFWWCCSRRLPTLPDCPM